LPLGFKSDLAGYFKLIECDPGIVEAYLYWDETENNLCLKNNELNQMMLLDLKKEFIRHTDKNYSIKNEPLAKAIGLGKRKDLTVLDASCGTGKDAMLLLNFNVKVIAIERHPSVFSLIYYSSQEHLKKLLVEKAMDDKFLVYYDDLLHMNFSLSQYKKIDVVYFDPMYPDKKKSAKSRKEMEIFKKMVGNDEDAAHLDQVMLANPHIWRWVIKRSIKAPPLVGRVDFSYFGNTTRYDVYSNKS
jgi:16S rRNA (guanine1516-N2)-methyltransferase